MAKGKPAPLTDEERAELLMMAGKVSGDESPETFEEMLTKLKGQGYQPVMPVMGNNAARRILKGATLSGSEYLAEKAGAAPLSPGDMGDTGLEVAGGMIPALMMGGPMGAAAQSTKLAPLFKAAPRIASTVAGMAENALLGGVQAGFEGESIGEGAAFGAGTAGIIEGSMRAIGAIYAKGIRMPQLFGIGPKMPKGKIDPTLAKPFEKPEISLWEGMNTGLQRIAEKWGIDLPLIAARPNDKFADWLTHKMGQVGAMKPYLYEMEAKNDRAFKDGFKSIIEGLGNEPQMPPVRTGEYLQNQFNRLTETDLKGSASALYEQLLDIGLGNGMQLRNFRVDGTKLAEQLAEVLEARGLTSVTNDANANKIRNLIRKISPPKADPLQQQLSNLELNELWSEGKKLWATGGDNGAGAAREANALVNRFIRDTAADINPNAGGAFDVADTWWKKYRELKDSEVGKIMTERHPENIVAGLTRDVTTLRQVKSLLNDANPIGEQLGDQFVEILAKRKLAGIIEGAVDPKTKVLEFDKIEAQLNKMAGPPSARGEYMKELFGARPEVLSALEELHSLMRVTDVPRKLQAPKQLSAITAGGAEAQSMETTLGKWQQLSTLLVRWAYGGELGKFMTTTPAAQNPLLGGLRPAMGPERRPVQLLNTLRRGAGSTQRNMP